MVWDKKNHKSGDGETIQKIEYRLYVWEVLGLIPLIPDSFWSPSTSGYDPEVQNLE